MILALSTKLLVFFQGIEVRFNFLILGDYKSVSKVCRADIDKK